MSVWAFQMQFVTQAHPSMPQHLIEFYLHRVLPEVGVGMVMVHVGLDRGTKKSLLVECFEFLPLYFEIVDTAR